MNKIKKMIEDSRMKKKEKEDIKKRKISRQTYFCIGVCDVWKGKNAIHITMNKLRKKYNLKWLRFSMSYHKFSNLRELFQGDLTCKILKGIGSRDFEELECNCNAASKIDGKCIYNSKCRSSVLVYKTTFKDCRDFCIGNTQQHLKKRMNQHFIEVRSLVNRDLTSDSFAKHFASHFPKNEKIATKDVRAKITMGILWKGNPISCSKSFGKLNCSLCMKERLLILKALWDNK